MSPAEHGIKIRANLPRTKIISLCNTNMNLRTLKYKTLVLDSITDCQPSPCIQSWTDNSKWALHGDMMLQFAGCVAANMPSRRDNNMSVRMDVWGSLNGRFHQRLVDPNVDLLHAPWSPWSPVPWLFPLLRHLDRWRPWILDAKNRTEDDLLFLADFPGK